MLVTGKPVNVALPELLLVLVATAVHTLGSLSRYRVIGKVPLGKLAVIEMTSPSE